ncbi:hypothetical protein KA047_01020 [Candidatus Saccharibacteria bacterium]|nr:hypothetical protein [Candidatus Saccharibacteria bacterium]
MNVRNVALPVAGACLGIGAGLGVVELLGQDRTYAAQMAAVEDCQYDLEDTPQQVAVLSDDCERYEDYFAYNYQTGNYYVPAAGELPDFLPLETEAEINNDMADIRLLLGAIGGIGGFGIALTAVNHLKLRDEAERANSFPEPQLERQ